MARLPFLLSIVHGGLMLPRELAPRVAVSPADIFFDSNPWTREIFNFGELVQGRLDFETARIIIDLDKDPAQKFPITENSIVKLRTRYNKPVWKEGEEPPADEVNRLIDRYHRMFHETLERTASRGGVRMGIDCHSMAPVGAPLDPDPGAMRPMFCIGNLGDENGEGEWLSCNPEFLHLFKEAVEEEFSELELAEGQKLVSLNTPYAGGYVLKRHRPDKRGQGTPWLQFTINRSLVLKDEPEDPATCEVVPDSDREVVKEVRRRVFRAFSLFAEKANAAKLL